MKNVLYLILPLILLIGCNPKNYPKTILLSASGTVETPPDEAILAITTSCLNKDIEQAKSCLIDVNSRLNDDFESLGIQKKDRLTTNVNLIKEFTWNNNTEVFNGYRASTTTNIRVRNLKILDELYSNLLSNEKLTVSPLVYNHSKMDSINNLAYTRALENANKLADQLIAKLPGKNKKIVQVSNVEIIKSEGRPGAGARYERLAEASAFSNKINLTINLGNIVTTQQLYVEYAIY